MHVGAAVGFRRHAVDGTDRLAVNEKNALITLANGRQISLSDVRLATIHLLEHFEQGRKVAVVASGMENAGATIAVKRLQDDVAHLLTESGEAGSFTTSVFGCMRSSRCVEVM